MDYYDERSGEPRRSWKVVAALAAVALAAGVGGWRLMADDGTIDVRAIPQAAATSTTVNDLIESTGSSAVATDPSDETARSASPDVDRSVTSTTSTAVAAPPTSTSTDTSEPAETTVPAAAAPPSTTSAPSTLPPTTTLVASSPPVPGTTPSSYPMSPDGTPLPIVAVFDTTTITISGHVPSQQAKDRLAALAVANSQFPDAQVVDLMVVNPAVPISVGVRVIELNSARFPEGTDVIQPEHAAELNRVVSIMNALPHISALVVGHADQRGDDLRNFRISDARARAVVNYFIYLGIQPSRLASRAAGETDLLTLGDDPNSLALNRRTEFIFYGLLIE